jgi:hypothetical protein
VRGDAVSLTVIKSSQPSFRSGKATAPRGEHRFIEVTSRLQIIAEHTQCLGAHHRGIALSDVQHQLMERDDHQHDQPEDVTRNIGIKRPNYATETVLLFRRCFLQHDRSSASL